MKIETKYDIGQEVWHKGYSEIFKDEICQINVNIDCLGEIYIYYDLWDDVTKERMQFISKDINNEIYNCLHVHDWFCVDNVWNLKDFRPLDIFYQCLNDIGFKTYDDIKKIKGIECYFTKEGELNTDVYYYNDKDKFNYKSFMDVEDLEVWQRLANLFDVENHKWCKCSGGKIVEYYEYWTHYRTEKGIEFRKIKCPIDGYHNFSVTTWIDEQFIEEDNIEKPNEL